MAGYTPGMLISDGDDICTSGDRVKDMIISGGRKHLSCRSGIGLCLRILPSRIAVIGSWTRRVNWLWLRIVRAAARIWSFAELIQWRVRASARVTKFPSDRTADEPAAQCIWKVFGASCVPRIGKMKSAK